jgi:ribosomal protein L37AE/L43A
MKKIINKIFKIKDEKFEYCCDICKKKFDKGTNSNGVVICSECINDMYMLLKD